MMADPRQQRRDALGLRTAFSGRLLPALVAAMSFLAALTLAGTLASASLAQQWRGDTESALTIQVPQPQAPDSTGKTTRLAAVQAALAALPGVADAQALSQDDVNRLTSPWLGSDPQALGLALPAVISARWTGTAPPSNLASALQKPAPGTLVDTGSEWAGRVTALAASLQTCAAAMLIVVALVAAAMVAVATRAGLAQLRETIEIVHGLGAMDSDISDRFAARATLHALAGSAIGTLLALPVLAWLSTLASPFAGPVQPGTLFNLPQPLWIALPVLPLTAALIGWITTQATVRGWLRRLP